MTNGQQWMTGVRGYPLCPKCGKYTLRRSSRHGFFGSFRAKYSNKRLYRCRTCGTRWWFTDEDLRYPTVKEMHRLELGFDSDILRNPPRIEFGMTDLPEEQDPGPGVGTSEAASEAAPERAASESESGEMKEPLPDDDFADFHFPADVSLQKHIAAQRASGEHRRGVRACPKCGDLSLHRSHTRNILEDLRKQFSRKRVYRCSRCQWRGWLPKN